MNQEVTSPSPAPAGKGHSLLLISAIVIAVVVFSLLVMVLNSTKPGSVKLEGVDRKVKGSYFVKVNEALIRQMYENWLPNDNFWPTALLDNMPNFQLGELEVVRYNLRVLRDNLTRMRTTDRLDPQAEAAFTALSNDPYKWWFPSAENRWKQGYKSLEAFYPNLVAGKSNFYARADNLVELITQYVSLMGGANTRLVNAPRDVRETISLEGEKNGSLPEYHSH